jgi:hypothetical protein
LFHPTTQRVPATPDLWRDGHDRRRLIGVFMLVLKNHPNRAGADLGRKPVCSVTFSIGSINTYFGEPPANRGRFTMPPYFDLYF